MHTFKAPDGTVFHFNSDFSGDVIVQLGDGEMRVSGSDLLAFIAKEYCLPAKISLLEEIGADSDTSIAELRQATPAALLLGSV